MKALRRRPLIALLVVAPLLLGGAGRQTRLDAAAAAETPGQLTPAHQLYLQLLGDWVGTEANRIDGSAPTASYFHLVITRADRDTFREEYTFYRFNPKSGALERTGSESLVSTIQSDGVIHQSGKGSGTILIDLEPKNQSFEVCGEAQFTGANHLESAYTGKISVAHMPMNLGKNGKLRKVTVTWSLENGTLIGRMEAEAAFHAVLVTKRYHFETQFQARRGSDVQSFASRIADGRVKG